MEYSRHGSVIKGNEKPVIRSKYEEDVYLNNHTVSVQLMTPFTVPVLKQLKSENFACFLQPLMVTIKQETSLYIFIYFEFIWKINTVDS